MWRYFEFALVFNFCIFSLESDKFLRFVSLKNIKYIENYNSSPYRIKAGFKVTKPFITLRKESYKSYKYLQGPWRLNESRFLGLLIGIAVWEEFIQSL